MRNCNACKRELALESFPKDKTQPLGRSYRCKECERIVRLDRYHSRYKNDPLYIQRRKDCCKAWQSTHKDKIKADNKEYRRVNKVAINEQHKEYQNERRKLDPNFRVLNVLRTRLGQFVKGENKSLSTLDLLGCSVEDLRTHLASSFKEGMSWDNYGEWHIDHIRPCASFDLTLQDEQKKCFHYTNLQPLWSTENILKSDTYSKD